MLHLEFDRLAIAAGDFVLLERLYGLPQRGLPLVPEAPVLEAYQSRLHSGSQALFLCFRFHTQTHTQSLSLKSEKTTTAIIRRRSPGKSLTERERE